MRKLYFMLFIAISITSHSQFRVYGRVVDTANKPVASANVLLLNAQDSVLVRGMLTNEGGSYNFENINAGKYLITATRTGNEPVYSHPFEVNDKDGNIDMGITLFAVIDLGD